MHYYNRHAKFSVMFLGLLYFTFYQIWRYIELMWRIVYITYLKFPPFLSQAKILTRFLFHCREVNTGCSWLDIEVPAEREPESGELRSLRKSIKHQVRTSVIRKIDIDLLWRIVIRHHREHRVHHHQRGLEPRISRAHKYVYSRKNMLVSATKLSSSSSHSPNTIVVDSE